MRSSTSYNWQQRFLATVQDIYAYAIQFHMPHEWILDQLGKRVYNTPAWKKVPAHVHTYIFGWQKCKANSIYAYHLEWCLSVDGKLLTREEVNALSDQEIQTEKNKVNGYRSPWARCEVDGGQHVWLDRNRQVLKDKPY